MKNLPHKIASLYLEKIAKTAEKEAERLLMAIIKGSPFENKAFSVGGFVRDELFGRESKDLDVVVEIKDGAKKLAEYIHGLFKEKVSTPRETGKSYPIWTISFKDDIEHDGKTYETEGADIDIADTMKESYPDSSSRQRDTEYGTIEDDIKRRDFTINMLLKDLTTGEIKDMTGVSKDDLKKGILRGHPEVSLDKMFNDDPLRMLRLIRFQAKYGFKIPGDVIKAVKRNADRIKIVSAERIMEELSKIMKLGKLRQAVKFFKITGLLEHIFPEVNSLINVQQGKDHHAEGDVYRHTLKTLENAPATIEGQMAALLHDIGKPATQTLVENQIHFYEHEDVGAEIAEAMLRRLKFDNKSIERIKKVVKSHMRPYDLAGAGEKALRKFIRDVGDELVDSILELVRADELGSLPYDVKDSVYDDLKKKIEKIRNSPEKVIKKAILNGNEIMDLFKENGKELAPGPKIKEIQNFLLELADHYASQEKELTKEEAKKKIVEHFLK